LILIAWVTFLSADQSSPTFVFERGTDCSW